MFLNENDCILGVSVSGSVLGCEGDSHPHPHPHLTLTLTLSHPQFTIIIFKE